MQVKAMWRVEEKYFNPNVYATENEQPKEHSAILKNILSIL